MMIGKVKWFDDTKGFGFLTPDGGERDAFVHYTQIRMKGRRTLEVGQAVEFRLEATERGPRAMDVSVGAQNQIPA